LKRAILDEGVPKGLARRLRERGIDATAFPNDWKQLSNGVLLNEIERRGFKVLITNDKQMQFQQALTKRNLGVIVLPTNLRLVVYALVADIADAVERVEIGKVVQLAAPAGSST
jgi:hypothetical protein